MTGAPHQALRDIRGLDPASWWPLAPGWWLVAGLAILVAALIWWAIRTWPLRRDRWRREANARLKTLRRRLERKPDLDPRETKDVLCQLSELLRRIAVALSDRRDCAGLTDEEWLDWLASHDPEGFDWRLKGPPLLASPYAPETANTVQLDQLRELVDAARPWVWTERIKPIEGRVWSPIQVRTLISAKFRHLRIFQKDTEPNLTPGDKENVPL